MGQLLEVSGVGPLLPFVAVVAVIGVIVAIAFLVFGAGRIRGRSGDVDELRAQLEAQMHATRGRGGDRAEDAPAWDGEDRLGLPRDLSESGM